MRIARLHRLYLHLAGAQGKGIAKKTVLEHWKANKNYDIRLHIINNNKPALKFWDGIFELEKLGSNEIDTLYRISGVKPDKEYEIFICSKNCAASVCRTINKV